MAVMGDQRTDEEGGAIICSSTTSVSMGLAPNSMIVPSASHSAQLPSGVAGWYTALVTVRSQEVYRAVRYGPIRCGSAAAWPSRADEPFETKPQGLHTAELVSSDGSEGESDNRCDTNQRFPHDLSAGSEGTYSFLRMSTPPRPVRRLDPILVDRIAAGEVVERPASAVKELVENAIDAGARSIEVTIEGGGRRLIRVVDDGAGMDADDLALAVERHATSKLPGGDLSCIETLGFRGEALPSIGAVARLTLTSRTATAETGVTLTVDAGNKGEVRPAPSARGTRIEVSDLFSATPARLKFLKSDRAEAAAIGDILRRLAVAQPQIRLVLRSESGTPLVFPAETEAGPSRFSGG